MLKFKPVPRVAASLAVALFIYGGVASSATVRAQETQPAQRRDVPPVAASPTPTPSPAAAATTNATTATDNHDLSITANVTARELRFEVVPNPKVEFTGQPRRDTVWEAERTNLPAQVQPGVTYRDIGIRLKITSVFADIERIVAEALGEIPTSDSNTNTPQTPEPKPGNAPPQTDNAMTATGAATQTNDASQAASASPQAAASTQTSRAPSAKTTNARRKNGSHAQTRRGRN